ncbi:MAG: dTDP-4-dehydrorhamnose reductase [Bacteroidota bacterium]|nr:dTDP-4-dehydrorhamnose reductase [Bacteroidota bacterium]
MNILVTGSNGQLGNEIQELSRQYPSWSFRFIDINELDLSSQKDVRTFFSMNQFGLVVHCAAYTAVDKAEQDPLRAMTVNATVPGQLAALCAASGTRMILISTDYVFNGRNFKPYSEKDPVDPLSVYGRSKYEGEKAMQKESVAGLILRTSWLYSGYGSNFVKSILNKAKKQEPLRVVFDQIGTPTYARDLAKAILEVIPEVMKMNSLELYHFSNEGAISWYDFAKAIVDIAEIPASVSPIETRELTQIAERPFYSVLNKAAIRERFGITIPYWRDSLKDCLSKLL